MTSGPIRVAILDDYASTSKPIFEKLIETNPNLNLQIDSFPDTLPTRAPSGLDASVTRLQPYTIISTMRERTPFPAELLSQLPNLKLLLTTGNRNASIDVPECERRGIILAGTGSTQHSKFVTGYDSTNEQNWALILGVVKQVAESDFRVKAGGWQSGLNTTLAGKTLGLLGLGRLGAQCAVTGKLGFGMQVLAWSSNLTQEKADEAAEARGLPAGSFKVAGSKEELFREADVLSVHYVLSDRSRGIVGSEELGWMKKNAVLVNTSRGPLVEEAALVKALRAGDIRAVGLDVFDVEPLPSDSVWRSQDWGDKVLLSPHMGYVVDGTMQSWYEQTAENIKRWVLGEEVLKLIKS